MSESPTTRESLVKELEASIADMRQQSVAHFDRSMLAWLALVPVWTGQLALLCEFPGVRTLSTFLEEAQAAGFCLQKNTSYPHQSAWYSALVSTDLAPFLSKERQKDALAAVLTIEDEHHRGELLAKLAGYVPKDLLSDIVKAARAIENPTVRATAMIDIALNLGRGYQETIDISEILMLGYAIPDVSEQAEVFPKLLPYLAEEERHSVMQHLLEIVPHIADESERARVLVQLAPLLPEMLWWDALWMARSIENVAVRIETLTYLTAYRLSDRFGGGEGLWIQQGWGVGPRGVGGTVGSCVTVRRATRGCGRGKEARATVSLEDEDRSLLPPTSERLPASAKWKRRAHTPQGGRYGSAALPGS